jgi:hypothetical protein
MLIIKLIKSALWNKQCDGHSLRHILWKYNVNLCFRWLTPGLLLGGTGSGKASVIRSEIRSRAERNCALPLFLHPSHQRDTAHRPIGTGRLRARRRFGYRGDQNGQSVLPVASCAVFCRTRIGLFRGFDTLSRPTICTLNRDYLRFRTLKASLRQAKEFWSASADHPASDVSA